MLVLDSAKLVNHLNKKTSVALGSFDAMHKGHLAVIKASIEHAKANNLVPLIQIFDTLFFKECINPLEKRLDILEKLGAEVVVIESFDENFRNLDYRDFVLHYLSKRYNASSVFAGENYRFGHLAEGDVKKLTNECLKYGISTHIIKSVRLDDVISSTKIRDFLKNGDVELAAEYMTRPFAVSGTVVHGKAIGRDLGFPTANLLLPTTQLVPKDGVYLTRVLVDSKKFFGITNIGPKPTIDSYERNIETYISGFSGDLYEKPIEIEFLKRIRDIKKFDCLEDLKAQLECDKKHIPVD